MHISTRKTVLARKCKWQELFGTQSDVKNAEILSKAKLSTTSSFAAAGHVPWMVGTIIFEGAAISEIGKNYPKLKKRRTMAV